MSIQTIIGIGDSTMIGSAGFDDSAATQPVKSVMRHLQELLRVQCVNTGVGGTTTGTIRSSFLTLASTSNAVRRGVIICAAGTNDLNVTTPATLEAFINEILAVLATNPKQFVLYGPFADPTWTTTQKNNIAAIQTAWATTFADYYVDMSDFHVTDNIVDEDYRRYNSAGVRDTLHPNSAFYEELANRIFTKIVTTEGWATKARLKSLRYETLTGRILLTFLDGGYSTAEQTTFATLSGTNQTRLNNALALITAKKPDGGATCFELTSDDTGTTRYFAGVGFCPSDVGAGVVTQARYTGSVASDVLALFQALEG